MNENKIKIYNTLSGKKEDFKPIKDKTVTVYICGITPYDEVHLGHARAYTVFDIVKRHLLKRGYEVVHIQNFTDIDDKIIDRAAQRKIPPSQLAQIYIDDYFVQTEKLNILKASKYPRVTDMIADIIAFIKDLADKGFAYQADDGVYFNVEKFEGYGKLSKRKIEDLKAGARVDINESKKSPVDFALWKKSKAGEPQDVSWDSPWGKGRPGWHIECSAMSSKLLGDQIDIHGGGQDLIFPHHENEIAQSEAKSGCHFVKYWMHNGFVVINKEKMSKSLGNFFSLSDTFKRFDPRVIRYYLISQSYRSPLDFSDDNVLAAQNALQGLDDAYLRLLSVSKDEAALKDADLSQMHENFLAALDDDFNCEKALSYLHELKNLILNELFKSDADRLAQLKKLFLEMAESSLGIKPPEMKNDGDMYSLLEQRNAARKSKNWSEADRLRKLLDEKGYKIVDNQDGTSVLMKKI